MNDKLDLPATYRQWVARAKLFTTHGAAMKHAVGGEFEAFGVVEAEMLRFYGLSPEHTLVDVGCGSGRLAIPLSRSHRGRYLGTDLVPELLDHARDHCQRRDWRFELAQGLRIPEKAGRADMVSFFSVFTHLLHEQIYLYLEEARRVLKPGGRIVFSFLEFSQPSHWAVFENTVEQTRRDDPAPLNVFIDRDGIRAWSQRLDLTVVDLRDGDEPFVPLPRALTLSSGAVMETLGNLGQSICVLEKPC